MPGWAELSYLLPVEGVRTTTGGVQVPEERGGDYTGATRAPLQG